MALANDTLVNNDRFENMEKSIQIKLLKYYARPKQCYMKMVESFGKILYPKLALHDCDLIGINGTFESILRDVALDGESLIGFLRQIQIKAIVGVSQFEA